MSYLIWQQFQSAAILGLCFQICLIHFLIFILQNKITFKLEIHSYRNNVCSHTGFTLDFLCFYIHMNIINNMETNYTFCLQEQYI